MPAKGLYSSLTVFWRSAARGSGATTVVKSFCGVGLRAARGDLLAAFAFGLVPGVGRDLGQQAAGVLLQGFTDRSPVGLGGLDRVIEVVGPAHGRCRVLVGPGDGERPAGDLLVVGLAGDPFAVHAFEDRHEGVVGGAVRTDHFRDFPPDEGAEVFRGGLALGQVGLVILGEGLGVDQAFLVPLVQGWMAFL